MSRSTLIIKQISILEVASVVKSLADKSGTPVDEVEKMWKEIKRSLIKQGKEESEDTFFGLLVSILKKKLGLQ